MIQNDNEISEEINLVFVDKRWISEEIVIPSNLNALFYHYQILKYQVK